MESKKIVKAIDLGYGNVKAAEMGVDGDVVCTSFPAMAPVASERDLAVHRTAKRNTVVVPIGDLNYEVGPDAALVQTNFHTRNLDNDYVLTDEYLALCRGALRFLSRADQIDVLVLGLPVSLFNRRRVELQKRMVGTHPLGDGLHTTVRHVQVMAQPMGAFLSYATTTDKRKEMLRQRNLIVDAGWRTFDWVATQGLKIIEDRSDAVDRGMFDVVQAVAHSIERSLDTTLMDADYFRIDAHLRRKNELRFFGQAFDVQPHLAAGKKVVREAITALKRMNKDGGDIDNIVMGGGGEFFFADEISRAYPKHKIVRLPDPIFANVRGFLVAGLELVAVEERRAMRTRNTTPARQ